MLERPLLLASSKYNRARVEIVSGRAPFRLLVPIDLPIATYKINLAKENPQAYNERSFVKFPSSAGRDPVRRLLCIATYCSDARFPTELGIVP